MYLSGESLYIEPLNWVDVNRIDFAQVPNESWATNLKRGVVTEYHDIYRTGIASGKITPYNGTNNIIVVDEMTKLIDPTGSESVKRIVNGFLNVLKKLVESGDLDGSKVYVDAGEQKQIIVEIEKNEDEQKKAERTKPLSEINKTAKIISGTAIVVGIAYIVGKLK